MLISCPSCRKQLKVPETAAGKRVKCPGCGNIFEALEEATERIQAEAPAKRPRPAPPPVDEEIEDRPRRRRADEDEDDAPPPRSRGRRREEDEELDEGIRDRHREARRPRDEEEDEVEEERDRSSRRRARPEEEDDDYDDRPRRKRRREEEESDDDRERSRKQARRRGKAAALWFLLAAIATLVMTAVNAIAGIYLLSNLPPPQVMPNAQVATTVKMTIIVRLLGCGVVEVVGVIFQFLARSSLTSLRGKGKVVTAIVFALIFGTVYVVRVVGDIMALASPVVFVPKMLTISLVVLGAAAAFFNLFAAIKGIVTLNSPDVKKAFRRKA